MILFLPNMSERWFKSLNNRLERTYLQNEEPWKQSGFLGEEEYWIEARKPIIECLKTSGTFLDIGCANGYLLECLVKWGNELSLELIPYGIDLSEKLVKLAKQRHPKYQSNFHVGNAWTWKPLVQYDYVRTELEYVPRKLQQKYIKRLYNTFLRESGTLIITEYRSRNASTKKPWINLLIEKWGYQIKYQTSGFYKETEVTRVVSISK